MCFYKLYINSNPFLRCTCIYKCDTAVYTDANSFLLCLLLLLLWVIYYIGVLSHVLGRRSGQHTRGLDTVLYSRYSVTTVSTGSIYI